MLLLAVVTFVALAPLCSAIAALPDGSVAITAHTNHAIRTDRHVGPLALRISTIRDNREAADGCALYSCCAAAELANTAPLRLASGTVAFAAVATTAVAARPWRPLADLAGPASMATAAAGQSPLRL